MRENEEEKENKRGGLEIVDSVWRRKKKKKNKTKRMVGNLVWVNVKWKKKK